ncbi:MAG: PDZ domain-containing protein [Planctomycetes bacterium]|nr:PDZ domain-containing protein [Planctomycetota bacterium]
MTRVPTRLLMLSIAVLACAWLAPGSAYAQTDLSEFKTVETAITTKLSKAVAPTVGSPGYLGVATSLNAAGKLIVSEVEDNSPAARAGLKAGDLVIQVDGKDAKTPDAFRGMMQNKGAGETVKLGVQRGKDKLDLTANLVPTSRVMQLGQKRAALGIQVDDADDGRGAVVKSVVAGLPAEKAGIKVGDLILKIDNKTLVDGVKHPNILIDHKPGDTLTLLVMPQAKEKQKEIKITLVAEPEGGSASSTPTSNTMTRSTPNTGKTLFFPRRPTPPPASPAKRSTAA